MATVLHCFFTELEGVKPVTLKHITLSSQLGKRAPLVHPEQMVTAQGQSGARGMDPRHFFAQILFFLSSFFFQLLLKELPCVE